MTAARPLILEPIMGRPVIDRTGLTGLDDAVIDFAPDSLAQSVQTDGPSLQTALQEQLGLKLQATGTPVEV